MTKEEKNIYIMLRNEIMKKNGFYILENDNINAVRNALKISNVRFKELYDEAMSWWAINKPY